VGYVITDGIKKELSPVEMKSHIFDLLGYPQDLVAKGKDLIYRYTVYTPQEEMKRILAEDKDARLNTLRKVFNIDRYKKIRENSSIFIRSVKEKKKEFEGFISDLEEKKKELDSMNKEIFDLDEKIKIIMPKSEKAKEEVNKKRENISIYEDKVNELNRLRKNLDILELELNNNLSIHNNNNKTISKLNEQITEIEKDLEKEGKITADNIKEKINETEKNIKNFHDKIDNIKQKLNENNINKSRSEEIINKISDIERCPLCLQNVEHEHKNTINDREKRNISNAEENIKIYSEKEKEIRNRLDDLEKEKENLRKAENRAELVKLKMQNVEDKKKEKSNMEQLHEEIKEKIGVINTRKFTSFPCAFFNKDCMTKLD